MEAGEIVQRVAQRVRGDAHTPAVMLEVASKCQQIVNAARQIILDSTTLSTVPYLQIYDISTLVPEQVHVLSVREATRDLDRLRDWRELSWRDRRWFRKTSSRFESFAQLGRDILIVHPAKEEESSVTVVYVKLLDPFESMASTVELHEEHIPLVVDLAELLLLLKERRLDSIPSLIQRVQRALGGPDVPAVSPESR